MSNAHYLASIAKALGERVLPIVSDVEGRDVLAAAIRALAGLSDAAERDRYAPPPARFTDREYGIDLAWPPENGAVRHRTAAAIAAGADRLAGGAWLESATGLMDARALVDWERGLMQTAIGAMRSLERQGGAPVENPLLIRAEAVERYFRERVGESARITHFHQAIGGRSRQTVLFTLENDVGLPRDLVIQRDHPAGISPTGVAHEFPVLELLAPLEVMSPRPVFLETSPSALGAPFIVMERSPGRIVGPDYFDPPKDPSLGPKLAAQLAMLHRADATPVAPALRHTLGKGVSWAAELDGLEATWTRLTHWPTIAVTATLSWMRAHVGEIGDDLALIHNDAAFHNILIEDGAITALLDWELVHIGHPAEDIGYCRPFLQEMGAWDLFVDAYVAAGGRPFSRAVIDYFSLRSLLYLTTLFQNGGRRMFEDQATDDINLAEVGASFMPKVLLRLANVISAVLEDSQNG